MNETMNKIIDATIVCIEKYGLDQITIRKISEEASVNSAAISYYFRSKNTLIDKVMQITLENAFRWEDFKYTESMSLEDQLNEIFIFFANNSMIYKNLGKAHVIQIASNQEEKNGANDIFIKFLQKLSEEVQRKSGRSAEESKEIIFLLSSWFFPFISTYPHMFDEFLQTNFCEENNLKKIIRLFVKKLL